MKIYFSNSIKDNRITRTIFGLPSSCDITSYISPEDKWGAVDKLDGKKITSEDLDDGVLYLTDEQAFYKIESLKNVGFEGMDVSSLHGIITTVNLF